MTRFAAVSRLVFLVGFSPLACKSREPAADPPPVAAPQDSATPASNPAAPGAMAPIPARSKRGRVHPTYSGPLGRVLAAAWVLRDLTPEQEAALGALEEQVKTNGSVDDDMGAIDADRVAGIRAGKLDDAKLQQDYAAAEASTAARASREVDQLAMLFATLQPAQRATVAAAVRARDAANGARVKAPSTDWPPNPNIEATRLVYTWTPQLGLDDTQRTRIQALVAKNPSPGRSPKEQRESWKKRLGAVLDAFEAPAFDPKAVDAARETFQNRRHLVEGQARLLSQVLPILRPEQRRALAAQEEAGEIAVATAARKSSRAAPL